MFRLHALRTGCLAGKNYPIVDPNFCMKDANGEFSTIFTKIWHVHANTLVGFSKLPNGLPDVDFKFDPSKIFASGGGLTPDSPSTLSPSPRAGPRKQKSLINMAIAYWSTMSTPSTSGSPSTADTSGSPRVDISTTSESPTLNIEHKSSTVRIALQDFIKSCRPMSDIDIRGVGNETRFPLLKSMLTQKDVTLGHLQV